MYSPPNLRKSINDILDLPVYPFTISCPFLPHPQRTMETGFCYFDLFVHFSDKKHTVLSTRAL